MAKSHYFFLYTKIYMALHKFVLKHTKKGTTNFCLILLILRCHTNGILIRITYIRFIAEDAHATYDEIEEIVVNDKNKYYNYAIDEISKSL